MERSKINFGAFHLLLPYIYTNIIGLPYSHFIGLKNVTLQKIVILAKFIPLLYTK